MRKPTIYKRVIIEGFQSIAKPTVFQLDRGAGVNLVMGENGRGKSTIFNAILWCEYGANMKKSVATWEDCRPSSYRGTRVVIERTDGEFDYMIARHLDFTGTTKGLKGSDKLMIFKKSVDEPEFTDAHMVGDALHKADMQRLIEEQIGASEKVYTNSILFGQRVASLIETKNEDKRKLFEEMFDVAFVDAAKERAKEKSGKLSASLQALVANIASSRGNLDIYQSRLAEQKQVLETFEGNKKSRIASIRESIDHTNDRINSTLKDISELDKEINGYSTEALATANEELKVLYSELDAKSENLRSLKNSLRNTEDGESRAERRMSSHEDDLANVKENCPTCKSPLKKTDVSAAKNAIKDSIKKEKEVIKQLRVNASNTQKMLDGVAKEYEEFKNKATDKDAEVSKLREGLSGLERAKSNLQNAKNNLEYLRKDYTKLEMSLQDEEATKPPYVDVEGTESKIFQLSEFLKGADKTKAGIENDIENVEWWVKKGFGSGGLKAFVFNAMLNQLNIFAHKYAARLGFRVEFTVDMKKAQKPFKTLIFKGDKVRDYEDLSGGQKQRVDLCVAFAMYDMLSQGTNINILLMDECLENLDAEGVEVVLELLRHQGAAKSVYMITHNDKIDTLNCKTVQVSLDSDGNTVIE